MSFVFAYQASFEEREPSWWFVFCGNKLLVERSPCGVRIPLARSLEGLPVRVLRKQYVGALEGRACLCAECEIKGPLPAGMEMHGLRGLYSALGDDMFRVAGRAFQIMDWDRSHQFCGGCGSPTKNKTDERAKVCTACGSVSYPRMSPAIIVAVVRGGTLLLARASRFAGGMYSVLAGFVEEGESLEECVRREVKEEVDLEIRDIRYFGSQSWPFPNSLMIGFTAEYAAGEIAVDHKEIVDAGWFTADALPLIPEKVSIARKLIDWFVDRSWEKG